MNILLIGAKKRKSKFSTSFFLFFVLLFTFHPFNISIVLVTGYDQHVHEIPVYSDQASVLSSILADPGDLLCDFVLTVLSGTTSSVSFEYIGSVDFFPIPDDHTLSVGESTDKINYSLSPGVHRPREPGSITYRIIALTPGSSAYIQMKYYVIKYTPLLGVGFRIIIIGFISFIFVCQLSKKKLKTRQLN